MTVFGDEFPVTFVNCRAAVWKKCHNPYVEKRDTYFWIRILNRGYCRLWQRLPGGVRHLPDGPLILVGNHRSGVDPLLVQASVNRSLCFFMGRNYYRQLFWLRWLFRTSGAIPVMPQRINRYALAAAKERLRAGGALCIFPEGEACPRVPLQKLYPGAAWLAMETGATVLPFRISGVWPYDGSHMWRPFLMHGRARVKFGDPLHFSGSGKECMKATAEKVRQALRALR